MARKKMVFACSGACGSGQMANWIAARLDARKVAEMGCPLALACGNEDLAARAKAAPALIAIDACGEACVRRVLEKAGLGFSHYFNLLQWGARKTARPDFDRLEAEGFYESIVEALGRRDRVQTAPPAGAEEGSHQADQNGSLER